jgi:uncharacterized repeat protein (TIGR01451 family)
LHASATTTVQCPALTLTKTADASPVDAGAQIGFTITGLNSSAAGTGTAQGVVIDDPLPTGSGVSWSIATAPPTCSIQTELQTAAQTLHCGAVALARGASESIHMTSPTGFASCATLSNTASLSATNHPSLTADASIRVTCASLTLSKTADAATVDAGDPIGFVITATNSAAEGTGIAHGAVLDDPLPEGAGISWSILTGPPNCSIQTNQQTGAQTLHCIATDLAAGAMFSVHVVSATTSASCAVLPNTATLTATAHPTVIARATTTVQCPSVTLTKTADAGFVNAGEQIGFTITASNSGAAGTGTATDVVIDDPLPSGNGIDWHLEAGPATCSVTGVAPAQSLICSAADLAPGASEVAHVISASVFSACGTYENTATASLGNGLAPPPASASVEVQCSGLALTKTADVGTVNAGEDIGFTITATNAGPGTATDATLTDPLPSGEGVDWSLDADGTSAADCVIVRDAGSGAQVLTCTPGDLPAGAVVTVHVLSATTSTSCADYPNKAQLAAANAPSLSAQASTTVANCLGVDAQPPVQTPPGTIPLATTGPGHLSGQVKWALALLLLGGLMLLASRGRGEREGR